MAKLFILTGLLGLVFLSPTVSAATPGRTPATTPAPATGASPIDSSKTAICKGAGLTGANCGDKGAGLNGVIKVILNLLSAVVGIAAVIMIIISGLRYVTSGGDSSKVSGAKSALIYAIVGLVVVALAQFIVQFVFANAT